jgi:hypothetical protein
VDAASARPAAALSTMTRQSSRLIHLFMFRSTPFSPLRLPGGLYPIIPVSVPKDNRNCFPSGKGVTVSFRGDVPARFAFSPSCFPFPPMVK